MITPERNLLSAVVLKSVEDATKPPRTRDDKHHQTGARSWLASDSPEPMSFFWYCDLLGWESSKIRSRALHEPRSVYASLKRGRDK